MNGFRTPFGSDLRHVHDYILTANMKAFEHYFCTTGLSEADLQKEIREALDADGAVTMEIATGSGRSSRCTAGTR